MNARLLILLPLCLVTPSCDKAKALVDKAKESATASVTPSDKAPTGPSVRDLTAAEGKLTSTKQATCPARKASAASRTSGSTATANWWTSSSGRSIPAGSASCSRNTARGSPSKPERRRKPLPPRPSRSSR